jgi:carbonic anhydrase/acetyltransferase-like protein (isoleucine patch superfamily)
MAIYQIGDKKPVIPDSCYIAEEAVIIGDVRLGEGVSIWPGAVLRGDNEPISVLHTDPGAPLVIGKNVTVGHQVMLHGCTIGDGSLIGIQSVILNKSVVGKDCLVGAGAVITENKSFPDRSVIFGSPAKAVRELNDENAARLAGSAASYVKRSKDYKVNLKRIG